MPGKSERGPGLIGNKRGGMTIRTVVPVNIHHEQMRGRFGYIENFKIWHCFPGVSGYVITGEVQVVTVGDAVRGVFQAYMLIGRTHEHGILPFPRSQNFPVSDLADPVRPALIVLKYVRHEIFIVVIEIHPERKPDLLQISGAFDVACFISG